MRSIIVFTDLSDSAEANKLVEFLSSGEVSVTLAQTLQDTIDSASDVIVVFISKQVTDPFPPGLVETLKQRKVLGIGPGASNLFRSLGLQIGMGSFCEPHKLPAMQIVPNKLLNTLESTPTEFVPFQEEAPGWQFCASIGPDLEPFAEALVDRIQDGPRLGSAPFVVRQGSFVLSGLIDRPTNWTDQYADLIRQIACRQADMDFEAPRYEQETTPPGHYRFELASGYTETSHRQFFLQFEHPSVFVVTLEYSGSDRMQVFFVGDAGSEQLHHTVEQIEDGAPITINLRINETAIEQMRGRYWRLGIANIHAEKSHDADCDLRIQFKVDRNETDLLAIPGGVSYEYINKLVCDLADGVSKGEPDALQLANGKRDREGLEQSIAEAHGFGSWTRLRDHLTHWPYWIKRPLPNGLAQFYLDEIERKKGSMIGIDLLFALYDRIHGTFDEKVKTVLQDWQRQNPAVQVFTLWDLLLCLLEMEAFGVLLRKVGADPDAFAKFVKERQRDAAPSEPTLTSECAEAVYRSGTVTTLGSEYDLDLGGVLVSLYCFDNPMREWLIANGSTLMQAYYYVGYGIPAVQVEDRGLFGADYEQALVEGLALATDANHAYFTAEHLVRGLLTRPAVKTLLQAFDIDALDAVLAGHLESTVPRCGDDADCYPTDVVDRVSKLVLARGEDESLQCRQALKTLLAEKDTTASQLLRAHGVTRDLWG